MAEDHAVGNTDSMILYTVVAVETSQKLSCMYVIHLLPGRYKRRFNLKDRYLFEVWSHNYTHCYPHSLSFSYDMWRTLL